MNDWQEHAARAIRREQRHNPLERMKIAADFPVGANYRRGYNDAITDVIRLETERDEFLDDMGEWTPSIDADFPR